MCVCVCACVCQLDGSGDVVHSHHYSGASFERRKCQPENDVKQ